MELLIKTNKEVSKTFFTEYLPLYLKEIYLRRVNLQKFKKINDEFKINSHKIILFALDHLSISHINENEYIISVNKNIKLNGQSLMIYLNNITYGNLNVKGYPILYDIFSEANKHIEDIYWGWGLGD